MILIKIFASANIADIAFAFDVFITNYLEGVMNISSFCPHIAENAKYRQIFRRYCQKNFPKKFDHIAPCISIILSLAFSLRVITVMSDNIVTNQITGLST